MSRNQATSAELRRAGVTERDLLAFKNSFSGDLKNTFRPGHTLFVKKVRLNSGGYAPDHGDSYFGVNTTGRILFEVHDNYDSVFVRAPDKKTIRFALQDLGF